MLLANNLFKNISSKKLLAICWLTNELTLQNGALRDLSQQAGPPDHIFTHKHPIHPQKKVR